MNKLFKEQYTYLASTMTENNYKTVTKLHISPKDLVTPARLDFMAKLIYLDSLNGHYEPYHSYEIYKSHLLAFGGRRIKEPGNPNKDSIEKYIDVFQALNKTAGSKDKDRIWCEHNPIPVDASFIAMDGAHRISCALKSKEIIAIYYLKDYYFPYRYDYLFFRYRLLHESMILEMVKKYADMKSLTLFQVNTEKSLKIPFILSCIKYRHAFLPVYMLKTSSKSFIIITDNTHISPNYVTTYLNEQLSKKSKVNIIKSQEEIIHSLENLIVTYQKKEMKNLKGIYIIKDKLLRFYLVIRETSKKILSYAHSL